MINILRNYQKSLKITNCFYRVNSYSNSYSFLANKISNQLKVSSVIKNINNNGNHILGIRFYSTDIVDNSNTTIDNNSIIDNNIENESITSTSTSSTNKKTTKRIKRQLNIDIPKTKPFKSKTSISAHIEEQHDKQLLENNDNDNIESLEGLDKSNRKKRSSKKESSNSGLVRSTEESLLFGDVDNDVNNNKVIKRTGKNKLPREANQENVTKVIFSQEDINHAKLLPDTSSDLSDPTQLGFYDILMDNKQNLAITGKNKQHLFNFSTKSIDPINFFSTVPLNHNNIVKFLQRMGISLHKDRVLETIELLDSKNIEYDLVIYNTILSALSTCKDIENSLKIFQRLLKEGLKPNSHTFNELLGVHMRCGKVDESFMILKSMEEAYDLVPDTVNYSTMLNGCVINKQYGKAIELFSEARMKGMEPDSVTLSIMIDACAKDGRVEKAFTYYDEFKYLNLPPTEVTFNTLINACAKRYDDNFYYLKAFEILQEMDFHSFKPDIITYTSLLDSASMRGDIAVAEKLYKDIVLRKDLFPMKPDHRVFALMLNTYANGQLAGRKTTARVGVKINLSKANQILDDIEASGLKLNEYILDKYLRVIAFAGQIKQAQEIFNKKYKELKLTHSLHSYYIMIRMYNTNGEVELAEDLFKYLKNNTPFKPNYSIYLSLLIGFASKGYSASTLKYAREMVQLGFPPIRKHIQGILLRFETYPDVVEQLKSLSVDETTTDRYYVYKDD